MHMEPRDKGARDRAIRHACSVVSAETAALALHRDYGTSRDHSGRELALEALEIPAIGLTY